VTDTISNEIKVGLNFEDAVKVLRAIYDGSGYADADVGDSIIAELKIQFPQIDWDKAAESSDG
jgi:hypothetical protein